MPHLRQICEQARNVSLAPSVISCGAMRPLLFIALPLSLPVLLFLGVLPWLLVVGLLIFLSFGGSRESG